MGAYQAYCVSKRGSPKEQRELIYVGEKEELARSLIRDAIASGFDYGYIKQGGNTVAYLTEKSFV